MRALIYIIAFVSVCLIAVNTYLVLSVWELSQQIDSVDKAQRVTAGNMSAAHHNIEVLGYEVIKHGKVIRELDDLLSLKAR